MAENTGLDYDQRNNEILERIDTDLTTVRVENLDDLDAAVSSRASGVQAESAITIIESVKVETDKIGSSDDAASASAFDANKSIFARLRYIYSTLDMAITAAVTAIRGASSRTITEVYDLILTVADPRSPTTHTTVSGTAQSYIDSTWVDLKSETVTVDTLLTGLVITNSGGLTAPVFRITKANGTDKIFPYGGSDSVQSGKLNKFDFPGVMIKDGTGYKVQVSCTNANARTATLTELDQVQYA